MRKIVARISDYRTRCRLLALSIIYCLVSIVLYSQSPTQLFSTANQVYKDKNYEQAITAYQKLLSQGYQTAEIYYNLGNAYYKTNQIGQAILYYEKAQKIAPDDEDIRYNLKLANLKTADRIAPVPQLALVLDWQHFVQAHSSRVWAWVSVAMVWLSLLCFVVYLLVISLRRTGFYTGLFTLTLAGFFAFLAYTQYQAEYNSDQAILTIANAYVKSAPDLSGTDLFIIHEGAKVQLLDRVGDWGKVRLADGKVGWLQHNTYSLI